jgi:hypothetical protein
VHTCLDFTPSFGAGHFCFSPSLCITAFISFAHPRDAEDAVRYRDGYDFDGGRIRVEIMKGGAGGAGGGPPPDVTRVPATSQFRVFVFGLPKTASWQDLKDHFKRACDVTRTDVDRTGQGLVEFRSEVSGACMGIITNTPNAPAHWHTKTTPCSCF